ncbi:SpaA isopeptide-forming pilin-related protein [Macrococcus carouselicus]|uniref:VWA domain-containing protein n=1 Tax=Macrococcus carouselicus TaxID=69969 RepID=A0A9Q8CNA1_9STAP|nr:SpaA isopeptide-forming pilin-related protein [Macrococcus carouselicus]TDM03855.1 VWA domain-containing protein [Macrococcus carouselicus]
MKKIGVIYIMIALLLNMSLSTSIYNIALASTQTSSADQPEIIAVQENGKTNDRLNWKLLFNQQGSTWKERAVKLKLEGGHQVNDSELKALLTAEGITAVKSDTADNEYTLEFTQLDKPVAVEISTEILNEDKNFRLTLSTSEAGAKITATDTFYQLTELTGHISYQHVPDTITAPPTVILLIDKATGTVIQQQTIQPEQSTYRFSDVRKLTDDNRPIEYEVKTKPLGNYKTTVNQFDIEQTYMTTEVKGTVTNETGKPLTIEFVNQATKEAVDSMTVDKDAETYVADQLPLNDEQGQKIAYEVSVPDVEGYDKKINDYNIALTKLEEPTTEEATTEKATTEKSTTEETTTEKSTTEEATTEKSTTEEATTEEATTEKSTTEEATTEEATTEEATTEEATTEEAMTEETTTEKSTTEEATTEKSTTEEATTEEATTEKSTTEEATTEEATTEEAMTTEETAPVEKSIVYTAPKVSLFRSMSFASAPVMALAATNYSASDYTYTSNTYEYGNYKGTLEGVMSSDQSKIDWTFTFTNPTGTPYNSTLKNLVVTNISLPTTMAYSYSNPSSTGKISYSNGTTEIFKLNPDDTILKFSTPITALNKPSYSLTMPVLTYSSNSVFANISINLTGTFTLKEKSAAPVVNPVSITSTAISGTAAPGSTINVMKGTTQLATTIANSSGNYSVTIPKQPAGTILSVTSTETNKQVSDPTNITVSSSVAMTINSVYSNQTYVTGTAEPGAMVTLKNSMGTVLGSTKVSPDGLYFVELYRPLSAGTVITGEAVSTIGTKTATTTVLAATSTGTPGTGTTIIEPSPTYKGLISDMSWDERGLYRNRVPQPVEYNESFQWKAAQPTNTSNEYAIDLKTQGREFTKATPLDIVFVIDNSQSMSTTNANGVSRWTNMKQSVEKFIDQMTVSGNTNIAIVNYASNIVSKSSFSNNAATIKSNIPATYQTGTARFTGTAHTNTQIGINKGAEILKGSPNPNKVMIVLTDGAPTFSYKGIAATDAENITSFDYNTRIGDGAVYPLQSKYGNYSYTINNTINITNHGQPTISEAKIIKKENPTFNIFSIGLDTNKETDFASPDEMNKVLYNIASKDSNAFITTDTAKDLPNILNNIAQRTVKSIDNGVVTDPIGPMYDLNLGSNNVFDASDYTLTASDPALISNGKVVPVYDPAKRTITIPNLNLGKGEWVNINYKVKLRVTDDSFIENQWYPMNGTTTLKPTANSTELREYPVPEARAVSPVYSFTFNKLSDSNTPLGGATFELKDSTGKIMTQTSSTNGLVKFDNLKKGTYTLTETAAPSNYSKDPKTYTVVIASNGDIKVDGVLYSGTNVFKVINKKVLGSIEVIKHQSGDESKVLAGATFELRDSAGKVVTLTTGTDGKALFSALPLGSYTLVETKAPAGYQLKTTPVKIDVTSATKVVVKVANQSNSAVLPNTGGPGPLWFSIIGILVIIASLFSRKKFAHMN